jgi:hypothetical protein
MRNKPTLLHIVPALSPGLNGLGDFATRLAKELAARHDMASSFLAAGWPAGREPEKSHACRALEHCTSADLCEVLKEQSKGRTVLLHYVGYGYAPRGAPYWLLAGLRRWRRENPQARLLVWFHELYAFGPPWRSSFWTSPSQRQIAKGLARLADGAFTSREGYAAKLRRWREGDQNLVTLPVFSNVGEMKEWRPFEERRPVMVIFGSEGARRRAYTHGLSQLHEALKFTGAEAVVDIGPGLDPPFFPALPVPFRRMGLLPAQGVSMELSRARYGFCDYVHPAYLAKSSALQAMAAHGLVCFIGGTDFRSFDGLEPGVHYIPSVHSWIADTGCVIHLDRLGQNLFAWYQRHNLSLHAVALVRLVKDIEAASY